jgi:hypothetical protein
MTINESRLRQIIREEAGRALREGALDKEKLLDAARRLANMDGFFDKQYDEDSRDEAHGSVEVYVHDAAEELGIDLAQHPDAYYDVVDTLIDENISTHQHEYDDDADGWGFIGKCESEAEERGFFDRPFVSSRDRAAMYELQDEAEDIVNSCAEREGIDDRALIRSAVEHLLNRQGDH